MKYDVLGLWILLCVVVDDDSGGCDGGGDKEVFNNALMAMLCINVCGRIG
jgi:hypothetical protein